MDDIVCQIIRAAFSCGGAVVLPEGVEPQAVYAELQAQAIAGLALLPGGLADACADKALIAGWQNRDLRRRALLGHLLDVQDEALAALAETGIAVVILKGTVASMYYPDPALRSYGDIDLMVAPADLTRARAVLIESGFAGEDDEGVCDHHVGLEKGGIHLELHWRPNGIPRGDSENRLVSLFEQGLSCTHEENVLGHAFPAFDTMLNGAVLLLHARRHLAYGGLGFRQIIDWMLFARAYLAGQDWVELTALLGDAQLERCAKCLTRFCQVYLGMPQEGFEWCADVEDAVCADLLEHVMLLGNFGHKQTQKSGATALARARNPLEFLRNLQEGGMSNWKAARQHTALRPFAWFYQGCRYVRLALARPEAAASLRHDFDDAARRRKLGEEMGLYDL